jgi:hypothetical protein
MNGGPFPGVRRQRLSVPTGTLIQSASSSVDSNGSSRRVMRRSVAGINLPLDARDPFCFSLPFSASYWSIVIHKRRVATMQALLNGAFTIALALIVVTLLAILLGLANTPR